MITGFHAHVYYQPATKPRAAQLRAALGARPGLVIGRMHDRAIGPHPGPMFQVIIGREQLADALQFLLLNRNGLDVLLHPETGDDLRDHTTHAIWLGDAQPLRLDVLR